MYASFLVQPQHMAGIALKFNYFYKDAHKFILVEKNVR